MASKRLSRLLTQVRSRQRLHLTQPAVSKRIALLEADLSARLFDRVGQQVQLTEAGHALLHRARGILQQVDDTRIAIANLTGEVAGKLSLATSHHIGVWRLPPLLKADSLRYPGVSLDLHFTDSAVAYDQVLSGEMELGVVTLSTTEVHGIDAIRLWRDPLSVVVSAEHPLAAGPPISLEQLSRHPAILLDLSTFTGRIVRMLFDDQALSLNIAMSTNYLETIKMLISIGLGWSVLPISMLDDETPTIDVGPGNLSRDLGAIYHHERTLSNAARAFVALASQSA